MTIVGDWDHLLAGGDSVPLKFPLGVNKFHVAIYKATPIIVSEVMQGVVLRWPQPVHR